MHFDLASLGESALRLTLALVLGCAIGFERQWHQKMAGLRTNTLVALGSSGFVIITNLLLRPLVRLVNSRLMTASNVET